jgi:hypothetical protein
MGSKREKGIPEVSRVGSIISRRQFQGTPKRCLSGRRPFPCVKPKLRIFSDSFTSGEIQQEYAFKQETVVTGTPGRSRSTTSEIGLSLLRYRARA